MKIKVMLGIMLGLFLSVGQASYSADDEAKARLLKEYEKMEKARAAEEAERAKEAAKEAERLAKEQAEAERQAAEEQARMVQEAAAQQQAMAEQQATQVTTDAKGEATTEMLGSGQTTTEIVVTEAADGMTAEEAERLAKEQAEAELKAQKMREKNMTDSEKMDVEVQRIKKGILEINDRIDNYNKQTEMIKELEKNIGDLEKRVSY